ncbi:hypothetical protein P7K49_035557, partial [Saguinus oedipus]
ILPRPSTSPELPRKKSLPSGKIHDLPATKFSHIPPTDKSVFPASVSSPNWRPPPKGARVPGSTGKEAWGGVAGDGLVITLSRTEGGRQMEAPV